MEVWFDSVQEKGDSLRKKVKGELRLFAVRASLC